MMSDEIREEYLWDKSAPPDPEVERLERLLGGHKFAPSEELELPAVERRRFGLVPVLLMAAALVLAFVGARWLVLNGRDYYPVDGVAGLERLHVGDRLETGAGGATVYVAAIGDVEVGPNSQLRVERIHDGDHHLYLERGRIRASILALPEVFRVGTPAGLSIDLGCKYDLVADDGGTRLTVLTGRVAFEAEGRKVIVPRGFYCDTPLGQPPNVPVSVELAPEMVAAIRAVEAADEPDPAHLALITDVDDFPIHDNSVSLWHLFVFGASEATREAAYANLARAYPLPNGFSAADVKSGDEAALAAWREIVGRDWPGGMMSKVGKAIRGKF
jgi:hypothetical protein